METAKNAIFSILASVVWAILILEFNSFSTKYKGKFQAHFHPKESYKLNIQWQSLSMAIQHTHRDPAHLLTTSDCQNYKFQI